MYSFYPVPEVNFADIILPDPPEPVLDIAPGDGVIVHGKNGVDYVGFVKDTDPYQGLALVQIVDPYCPNSKHVAWWEVKYVEKKDAEQPGIPLGTRVRVLRSTDPYHVGRLGTVDGFHANSGALRVDIDLAWMYDWLQPCDLEIVAGEGEGTEVLKQTAAAR